MNNISELFSEWRRRDIHKGNVFISDGPIDQSRWESDDARILFVAKEAYSGKTDKEDWDLPVLVRDDWNGPKYKFWWSLGYWAIALRNTTDCSIPIFPAYRNEEFKLVRNAVLSSALMNIKKSGRLSKRNQG